MSDEDNDAVRPIDIVFSCSVCNATVSEIYQNADSDKGFRDGSNAEEQQPVTKLWLTECSHVTCSKHLDGGGIPFHRAGEQPCAVCPICNAQSGNKTKRLLYAIRGFSEGQYHPGIPKEWFETPPINLGAQSKGMEAMTFHYLALARFGTSAVTELRKARALTAKAEKQASEEISVRHNLENQVQTLKQRLGELEQCERELKPWKDREPKIKFYLDLFPRITKENERLREQLTAMGYAVPNRTYNLTPDACSGNPQGSRATHPVKTGTRTEVSKAQPALNSTIYSSAEPEDRPEQLTSSDRTLSGPGDPVANLHLAPENQSQPNRKRQREPIEHRPNEPIKKSTCYVRGESRSLMPPPPLPVNKTFRSPLGRKNARDERSQQPQQGDEARQDLSHDHPQMHLDDDFIRIIRPQMVDETGAPTSLARSSYVAGQLQNYDNTNFRSSPMRMDHQVHPQLSLNTQRLHQERFADSENVYLNPNISRPSLEMYSREQQPLPGSTDELHQEFTGRTPLLEQDASILNSQRYAYSGPVSREREYSQPLNYYQTAKLIQASPKNDHNQGPRTPSPFKRPAPPNFSHWQAQSVISPFFNRQTERHHSGLITLSQNAARNPRRNEPRNGEPQTPRQITRNSLQKASNYPQSTPLNRHPHPTPQRQQFSASRGPLLSNDGFFRRPDEPPRSVLRPRASASFRTEIGNEASYSLYTPATPRPNLSTRAIPILGSSTPSIRSNIVMPQSQTSPRKHSGLLHSDASLTGRRELTEYDLGYNLALGARTPGRYDHTASGTGFKSGVSRLSNEGSRNPRDLAKTSGLESRGFGAVRRSVRR